MLVQRIIYGYEFLGYKLMGANISIHRYYTSIPLVKWLLEKGITMLDTMNKIPKWSSTRDGGENNRS